MTLREKFNKLTDEVDQRFYKLTNQQNGYDIAVHLAETEYEGTEKEQLLEWLDNDNIDDTLEFNFEETLPQLYYNNRQGEEVMCYLLSTDEDGGLCVFDFDNTVPYSIPFQTLNGLWSKLDVIEAIEQLKLKQ